MKWMALVCVLLLMAVGVGEKTDHFNVKYEDMKYLSPGTGKVLETAYHKVNGYLGTLPPSIKVVVVADEKMDKVGKHVEAFSAWNSQSSTIVLRDETVKDKQSLPVVATHEICHLGLNEILNNKEENGYSWMEEGICMVISDEPLDDVKVSRYIVSHGYLNTKEIGDAVDSNNYNVTKNGYLHSFSLCKYIAKTYGMKTLVDIVKSPGMSFDDAFFRYTGTDFKTFYEDWVRHVQKVAAEKPNVQVVTIKGHLDLAMDEV